MELFDIQVLLTDSFHLVHRALLHQGILHRDISGNNILIRPRHRGTGYGAAYNDRPKFISDILKDSPKR